MNDTKVQWHPVFAAAMNLELVEKYAEQAMNVLAVSGHDRGYYGKDYKNIKYR